MLDEGIASDQDEREPRADFDHRSDTERCPPPVIAVTISQEFADALLELKSIHLRTDVESHRERTELKRAIVSHAATEILPQLTKENG